MRRATILGRAVFNPVVLALLLTAGFLALGKPSSGSPPAAVSVQPVATSTGANPVRAKPDPRSLFISRADSECRAAEPAIAQALALYSRSHARADRVEALRRFAVALSDRAARLEALVPPPELAKSWQKYVEEQQGAAEAIGLEAPRLAAGDTAGFLAAAHIAQAHATTAQSLAHVGGFRACV